MGVALKLDPPFSVEACVSRVRELGQRADAHGWVAATGGNFSVRYDAQAMVISATGTRKGHMTPEDVLLHAIEGPKQPHASAETGLHQRIYTLFADAGAVVHVHAPAGILASLWSHKHGQTTYRLQGYEMLKALRDLTTHETTVDVPVLANSQDIAALADEVERVLHAGSSAAVCPAFLLVGHGLTAWGRDAEEAFRHAEALEFLFSLDLERRRLGL